MTRRILLLFFVVLLINPSGNGNMKTFFKFQLPFRRNFNVVAAQAATTEQPPEEPVYLRFVNEFGEVVEMENRRDAVLVRNASKSYGKGVTINDVLKDLDLTVKEGTIYTLLGSSGCGKTTLLSCIVGMSKLDKGECRIFGKKPGATGCGIPGKKIGYMPQETALYVEFTIREAMFFFGRINGMCRKQVSERMKFLMKFLNLPNKHQSISKLSGGQQRRVSFAIALLHEPQILILDEPTVGVDPILRKSIWKYLRELVDAGRTTVVITTHYIEEANEAHRIGLMRNGRLLAEDSPKALLEQNRCNKLEEVFFHLCQKDTSSDDFRNRRPMTNSRAAVEDAENVGETNGASTSQAGSSPKSDENVVTVYNEKAGGNGAISPSTAQFNRSVEQLIDEEETRSRGKVDGENNQIISKDKSKKSSRWFECMRRESGDDCLDERSKEESWIGWVKDFLASDSGYWDKLSALLLKNFLVMYRNLGFVAFIFILPAVQAILFCVAIGGDPTNLPLGIINQEIRGFDECNGTSGCSISNLSCNYIRHIPEETLELIPFYNEKDALAAVKDGNIWGYFIIPGNFSDSIIADGLSKDGHSDAYEDSFQGTHLQLSLDMTSQQIAFNIQRVLGTAFQQFTTDLLFECGMNETIELPPPKGAKPIYGSMDASFSEFMAPGIILSIIFFMSVALTGSAFITERKEGMLTRVLVSGVTTGQIIVSQMLTQYVVMLGQTILVLAVMMWIFKVHIAGSITLAICLTICQGTCGMAFGFLISCICSDERNAIQMALGSFYPNLLLSGVVWPLESIPMILRHVVNFLPQTMACEAMRSIFSRGWGFTHPKVWPGFVLSGTWSILFWAIAALIVGGRKK